LRAVLPRKPLPEFLWDPARLRLTWANEAGLAFWQEDSLLDLTERIFAPGDETVRALASRLAEIEAGGAAKGRLVFSPAGAPILTIASCRREVAVDDRPLLRITLTEIDPPNDALLARMQAGFNSAPQAMAVIDASGMILAQNEADRRAFGSSGRHFAARFDQPADATAALATALSDGTFSRKALLRGDTGPAAFRVSLRRMRDPVTGALSAVVEFADHRDRPGTAFVSEQEGVGTAELAALVHDLRSPLTAIQGFAEFMSFAGHEMTSTQREGYLADIALACDRMQALIDGIIAEAAPSPGARVIEPLLEQLARLHHPAAMSHGGRLVVQCTDPSLAAAFDEGRLMRILDNLINNAVRHGLKKPGEIRLAATSIGRRVMIEVSDEGPGMTPEALEQALAPFGAPQRSGRLGGLGLSNCKDLAAEIGARLEITTAPGEGFSARLILSKP
jgi:signal transduction histidine kinase